MKKKTLVWSSLAVLATLGLVAAVAMQIAAKQKERSKKKDAEPALVFTPAEAVSPQLARLASTIELSGPLVAPQTAVVRAKSAGTLLSLAVAEGARVKAGQSLARVDSSDLDHRLGERRAMVESARAQAAQAERSHASNVKLADEKFISANALESSRVSLDAARAGVRAAEAQLGSVRAAATLATLIAPIDGIVSKRQVVVGEKLSPEQPVLTIVDLRRLEIAASVGTHEVGALSVGTKLDVHIDGVSRRVKGAIDRIAPAAEAQARSIAVAVTVPNDDESLRAGVYAVAKASIPDARERLTVPVTALVNVGGQDYVWVIEGGVLARRAVTTGLRDEASQRMEVVKGLSGDAVVLAMKFDGLREGRAASVGVAQAAPPPASAPSTTSPASAARSK